MGIICKITIVKASGIVNTDTALVLLLVTDFLFWKKKGGRKGGEKREMLSKKGVRNTLWGYLSAEIPSRYQ